MKLDTNFEVSTGFGAQAAIASKSATAASGHPPGWVRTALWHGVLLLSLLAAVRIEQQWFQIGTSPLLNPALGIAFAAVMLGGIRVVPVVLLAQALGHGWLAQQSLMEVFYSVLILTVQLALACMLRRFLVNRTVFRRVLHFNLFAAALFLLIAPSGYFLAGLTASVLAPVAHAFGFLQSGGWIGLCTASLADSLGMLLVGSGILAWRHDPQPWPGRQGWLLLLTSLALIQTGLVFSSAAGQRLDNHDLILFNVLPYLLLSAAAALYAAYYSPRVMTWLLLTLFATTVLALGDFKATGETQAAHALLLQICLAIYSTVMLSVSLLAAASARNQQHLMLNEQRYRELVESAPEAILLIDLDHATLVDANRKATEVLGFKLDVLLQLPLTQVFQGQPLDGGGELKFLDAILSASQDWGQPLLWRMTRSNGQSLTCEMHLVPLPTRQRRLVRISLTDITARLEAEQQRQKLEQEKLALLEFQQLQMNLMPVACLITDTEFRYTYWNPAAERMFGYSNHDIIGKLPSETILPDYAGAATDSGAPPPPADHPVRAIYRAVTREGHSLVCEWHHTVLRSTGGDTIGHLAMAVDITLRTQTEDALRESEERYRRMVEHSMEGIGIVQNGHLVYVNQAFVAIMHALFAHELVGRALAQLFTADCREAVSDLLHQLETQGQMFGLTERRLLRMDGEVAEVEISGTRVTIEGSEYLQVHVRDIGARKWTEREILRMNADLEQRVIERTAQLSEANRELESFSYSVAHDLRSPLRAISGFSGILMQDHRDQLSKDAQYFLERIAFGADRMAELIEDLLHLAQVSRAEARRVDVDMQHIVTSVLESLRDQYPQTRVILAPLARVTGDPSLLRQLMSNLLGNAFKFSARQPQPQIEIGVQDSPGETVFYVRDNGVGYDKAYQHKLFGVFQRLHSVAEFEGTGVGLAIVQRIAHRHGARVWSESEVGQGATFFVALPLAKAEKK